jgi:CubicO group peptidase (beta-lactamase class C family)
VLKYCSGDLEFTPGARFNYNNSGYFLLGAILEHATGKSYEQLLKERIFEPLRMTSSGYDSSRTLLPKRARGYERPFAGVRNATTSTCRSRTRRARCTRAPRTCTCGIRRSTATRS